MDDQNKNSETPQSQSTTLQPSQNFVDEMKTVAETTPTNTAPTLPSNPTYPEINNNPSPVNPINTETSYKKNNPIKTLVYVVIIFFILGFVTYLYKVFISPKVHSAQTAIVGHGYVTHDMDVNNKALFTISFDRSATKGGVTNSPDTDLVGNDLKGNQMAVFIRADTTKPFSPSSCYGPDRSTVPPAIDYSKIGTATVLGTLETICGYNITSSSADNTSSYVEFQSNGNWYNIQFVMTRISQSVDISSVSQIAQSIKQL